VLRRALHEADPLPILFGTAERASSPLTEVECLRSLDRLYQMDRLDADEVAAARAVIFEALDAAMKVPLDTDILARAGEPLPTPLGTLDAIHLVSALSLGEDLASPVTFATHDKELARCARACGLRVVGI
jgi:predicted nucleic acid-binding protein